ncbi:hypothetical protein BDP27DRAFT_1296642 [Rhodocollybia butyracea]|uniref:Uncharacterized protein n=1 Tax=Rhodocollybia butyracea TaxID=206335 RepID=A0A9P5PPW8_9AGAR|nr:hypothetical protein BDP27DRAFT_1296642 [Rhodocollybia butyracea]
MEQKYSNLHQDASQRYVSILGGTRADLILKSRDSVLFHVHTKVLSASSTNNFRGLAVAKSFSIEEHSENLRIILDIVYRNPSAAVDYAPPFAFNRLAEAIGRLSVYGVSLQTQLQQAPKHPILQALCPHAATHALQLYILAAKNNVEALAVVASTYLVGLQIADITDEHAEAMGPSYLRRLLMLRIQREESLKKILLQPPYPHPLTPDCDVLDQKALTRSWTLSAAYFAWDIRADLPPTALETLLGPLAGHVTCDQCKRSIAAQVAKIMAEWEAVKGSI